MQKVHLYTAIIMYKSLHPRTAKTHEVIKKELNNKKKTIRLHDDVLHTNIYIYLNNKCYLRFGVRFSKKKNVFIIFGSS